MNDNMYVNINSFKKAVLFFTILASILYSCRGQGEIAEVDTAIRSVERQHEKKEQWKGQGEISKVNTETRPVQLQYKGIFELGNGIYASNDFEGARLNGIALTQDSTVVVTLITPENTPINMSPWYSFKLWSDSPKKIQLKLTYPEYARHRYYPLLSKDGKVWKKVDSTDFNLNSKFINGKSVAQSATVEMPISKDTTWVSAQELVTNSDVRVWTDELKTKPFIKEKKIGESTAGRSINVLKIGEGDDQAMIVVLSRQHPPEVTGYKAMEAFVETIASDSDLAKSFRKRYNTYVVPLVNPDGVANGHWRHSMGGIDLNRDWEDFNQPETSAIKNFFNKKVEDTGGKIYFFIDFHSTWQDIYYTIDPKLRGNMPGLVQDLISQSGKEFENYVPNVKPSPGTGKRVTSTSYFFFNHGAESLTYEIGDNTPREFIKKKGVVTAKTLMKLMME